MGSQRVGHDWSDSPCSHENFQMMSNFHHGYFRNSRLWTKIYFSELKKYGSSNLPREIKITIANTKMYNKSHFPLWQFLGIEIEELRWCLRMKSEGVVPRWQRNRMGWPLSPPQIHQKIIWMLSNFHKTTSECWQRTPGIQKGSPFSSKGGRTKYKRQKERQKS